MGEVHILSWPGHPNGIPSLRSSFLDLLREAHPHDREVPPSNHTRERDPFGALSARVQHLNPATGCDFHAYDARPWRRSPRLTEVDNLRNILVPCRVSVARIIGRAYVRSISRTLEPGPTLRTSHGA